MATDTVAILSWVGKFVCVALCHGPASSLGTATLAISPLIFDLCLVDGDSHHGARKKSETSISLPRDYTGVAPPGGGNGGNGGMPPPPAAPPLPPPSFSRFLLSANMPATRHVESHSLCPNVNALPSVRRPYTVSSMHVWVPSVKVDGKRARLLKKGV